MVRCIDRPCKGTTATRVAVTTGACKREALTPGSFNYIPRKMIHQGWTKPDEGALLFITVDGAWDVNWVDGPPMANK